MFHNAFFLGFGFGVFGLSLDSDWIQFCFGFVLVWDWINARPFSNKPFAMNFLFTHGFLFMLLMEEFVLGTSHQSDYGMDELLKTAFYQYLLMIMVNGFNKTCPGLAIQIKACCKMPIRLTSFRGFFGPITQLLQ